MRARASGATGPRAARNSVPTVLSPRGDSHGNVRAPLSETERRHAHAESWRRRLDAEAMEGASTAPAGGAA